MQTPSLELIQQTVNESDLGILVLDNELNVALWNDWMGAHSGKSSEHTINKPLLEICPELYQSRVYDAILNSLETDQPAVISNVLNRSPFDLYPKSTGRLSTQPHQEKIQQSIKIIPLSLSSGMKYCMVQISDVSAAVQREKTLESQVRDRKDIERKLSKERALFIKGPTVVLTWAMHPEWHVDYISPNITLLLGYREEQFLNRKIHLPDLIHPDDLDQFLKLLKADHSESNSLYEQEFRIRNSSGEYRWVYNLTSVDHDRNEGKPGYLGYLLDITERKQFQEKIQRQAFYDELTGLPNRRMFLDRMERELVRTRRHSYIGALLFIDIDRFKQINDSLGHDAGDYLLKHIARRLTACLRLEDTAARLGGDEFVVILSDLGEDIYVVTQNTRIVAEKIRAALSEKLQIENTVVHSTPSIGIVTFPTEEESTASDLLRFADTAMYRAKSEGRNEIRFFSPDMQDHIENQLHLENSLRQALEKQEFSLNFQPLINNHGKITGAEALLRWFHPKKGWISPAEFIPIAEETGMILPLGEWALEEACRTLRAWESNKNAQKAFFLPRVAINVSPKQFRQANFVSRVESILDDYQLKPNRLEIELTEGIVVADVEDTINKMSALQSIGIHISIDDFGTGYSSLAYLKRLPIDVLKIDQSFVRGITTDKDNSAIVETIISMAKHMELDVIAEGIETQDELHHLSSQGCKLFQGYLFSKPLPADDFSKFYLMHKAASHQKNFKL